MLIDKFLEEAFELDVDAISDGEKTIIGGMMEHIEEAGIHSGDSACVLPPYFLKDHIDEMTNATKAIAKELNVKGLMNIQFGIMKENGYIILRSIQGLQGPFPLYPKPLESPLPSLQQRSCWAKPLMNWG